MWDDMAPSLLAGALRAVEAADSWRGPVLTGVFALLCSIAAGWWAKRAAETGAANEARRIDREGYDRARAAYEADRATQHEEIRELRTELTAARSRIFALEETVARQRRQLIAAGLDEAQA